MNLKIIFYILGWIANIEAACMVLPLICAFIYSEPIKWVYVVTAIVCLMVGIPLTLKRPKNKVMFAKEGFVAVALSWIMLSIFGALPFLLSKYIPNIADAVFETASGFTTTGASILTDVEILPESLLLWRSFTHWIGGMGVIVFLVALLPMSSGDNLHLIKAESPGPSVSKLVPKVKSTAKILYTIYLGLTLILFVLLIAGGLDIFSSLTLTFGTAGTGGFAILNSGLATYSSYTQIVITVFMIIFGIDFTFYYLIIMKKFKSAFKLEEVVTYLSIILVSVILITFNIRGMFETLPEAIKHTAFQVASIISTTGYSTVDFNLWPEFSKIILLGIMLTGACAGSTAGGIKVSRVAILFKSIVKEIKVLAHPKSAIKVKMNGKPLEHETLRGINVFAMAYVFIFAFALLIISLDNFDFTTNFTAVATTLSNVGPGLNAVGPVCNFSGFSALSKIVLTLVMITGRLEIFPMLILFSSKIWKK